jgi:hypothetical protein
MDHCHLNNITKLKEKKKNWLGGEFIGATKMSQKNLVQLK